MRWHGLSLAKAVRVYATTKCVCSDSDSKAMGEVEGLKLCVDGDGWSCENKGNIEPFGEKGLCSFWCGTGCVYFLYYYFEISKILYCYNFIPLLLLFLKINFVVCVECASLCVPWVRGVFKNTRWWWPPLVAAWMVGEPPRVPTAEDPAGCGERWGRVQWRRTGVW